MGRETAFFAPSTVRDQDKKLKPSLIMCVVARATALRSSDFTTILSRKEPVKISVYVRALMQNLYLAKSCNTRCDQWIKLIVCF